ncbi:nicotinamide phosphoribosyltransferase [Neoconidiobolus thromboides FSU 785]|nr:nicotinamide phosphoribosyltransferase [Neoconidiobolus thromboides FSU 785]
MSGPFGIPIFLLTDSYKLSHPYLFPDSKKMVAYSSFRQSYNKGSDERIIFFGLRYFIENYIDKQWSLEDLEKSKRFFETHNAGFTKFPFPEELFLKMINENNGYFPISIYALEEGTVVYPHVPVMVMVAEEPYSGLITYLEALLTMIWYPCTVATLSRQCKTIIEKSFEKSVDKEKNFLINSRLHDFGFRGCTSVEQSILGGMAHLLNFEGSDTLSAAYYGQFNWNNGAPIASSIPATEHSVMTSHLNEKQAILKMIEKFGSGVFACVMDSYDYKVALEKILPEIASEKVGKGGFMVLRPDSGDPIKTVLMALNAGDQVFGSTINSKGYKVLNGCGVIQGDGIDIIVLEKILDAVIEAGYSSENIAFGMGGGLLQKLNRDTMSFATKLSYIKEKDDSVRLIAKLPKTDTSKFSLPGQFMVLLDSNNLPKVYPKPEDQVEYEQKYKSNDLLKLVYNGTKTDKQWLTFDQLKTNINQHWNNCPIKFEPISDQIKELQNQLKNK